MFTLHRLPVNYLNLFDHMFTFRRLNKHFKPKKQNLMCEWRLILLVIYLKSFVKYSTLHLNVVELNLS